MQVGFRPRLKARPSLYDLVKTRNIESLSVQRHRQLSLSAELASELQLPSSPASSRPSTPLTSPHPRTDRLPPLAAVTMAPKKEDKKEAQVDEPHGKSRAGAFPTSQGTMAESFQLTTTRVQAPSTPSQGMLHQW